MTPPLLRMLRRLLVNRCQVDQWLGFLARGGMAVEAVGAKIARTLISVVPDPQRRMRVHVAELRLLLRLLPLLVGTA